VDCYPTVATAAAALKIKNYEPENYGEFRHTRNWIAHNIPTITDLSFAEAFQMTDCSLQTPFCTTALHHPLQ
jgi:hypothetical protein